MDIVVIEVARPETETKKPAVGINHAASPIAFRFFELELHLTIHSL